MTVSIICLGVFSFSIAAIIGVELQRYARHQLHSFQGMPTTGTARLVERAEIALVVTCSLAAVISSIVAIQRLASSLIS
jgi:hypothetical protein